MAIADSGDPIRYSPGELVALAQPGSAAMAFYLVTTGEVMLLPASLQIPAGTAQLDVSKVGQGIAYARRARGSPAMKAALAAKDRKPKYSGQGLTEVAPASCVAVQAGC